MVQKDDSESGRKPRVPIDYAHAERLLRSGMTVTETARELGCTPQAISTAISRGRINFTTGRARRLPWRMRPGHNNLGVPRGLRLAMRVQAGDVEGMGPDLRAQGETFLRSLLENDLVIHYEPDVSPHWFRVPKRPGIDEHLVREPDQKGV